MSTNPPAKHHYIPRFQLAQWGVDEGKLWRFLQPRPGKIVTKQCTLFGLIGTLYYYCARRRKSFGFADFVLDGAPFNGGMWS